MESLELMKKGRVADAEVLAGDFSDRITDGFKTGDPYAWSDRFTVNNTDGITNGFEMPDPYGWRDRCTVKNTEGITEGFEKQVRVVTCLFPVRITDRVTNVFTDGVIPSVRPLKKVNIWPLYRHSPPPFLLLLPNPKSPHLHITSSPIAPKQKSSSSQHNKLYILKFCGHNIRVLIYQWILSIFVSNSIFLNFNI